MNRMRHRCLSALLLAGLALAYFASLLYAASAYPSGYDWRHIVVSNLANPNDNPGAWRIAADGMAVTGIFLALLGPEVRRPLHSLAPKWTAWACGFFVLGGILLTVSALITPGHHALLGIGKAHAKIAQAAGVGFGIGMACTLPALLRLPPRHAWVRAAGITIVVVPMTFFLLCRIFVPIIEAHAPLDQQAAIHHSLEGSLAFWEWIGSVSVYAFLILVTLGLPDSAPTASRSS